MGRMNVKRQVRKKVWLGQFLFGLSLVFLGVGLIILAWAVWPTSMDNAQFSILAGILPGAPEGTDYASPADYALTVDWPTRLRMGQVGTLRGTLVEQDGTNVTTSDRPAQAVLVEPAITGLTLDPPGLVQTNLAAGQDLVLTWDMDPINVGDHSGKVYISFGFYNKADEELVTVPIAVVDMSVRVTSLWGLDTQLALWFGLIALVLWGAQFVLGRAIQAQP
jgi:hypothetical protein